jgi:hypothetical protein
MRIACRVSRACNRGERGKAHHTHHANHAENPTRTHAYHAHHSETQAARTHSTGGTRIAANGGAYAHSGLMHHDGRRCMEVGTSNKWYAQTASKQPAAHPPEHPQNPAIQLITTGAHPPVERNQKKPRNPPHHHRGPSTGGKQPEKPRNPPQHRRGPFPTAKRRTSCAAAQQARPAGHMPHKPNGDPAGHRAAPHHPGRSAGRTRHSRGTPENRAGGSPQAPVSAWPTIHRC